MTGYVADAVDEVTCGSCEICAAAYEIHAGWQGICPPCCAVVDDHLDGDHGSHPVTGCDTCDDAAARIGLPATA